MKVVFAAEARVDLREIADWIGRSDPVRALAFAAELRAHCRSLDRRAALYPLAAGLEDLALRRRLCRGYLIFHRIDKGKVTVVRILHGARNYRKIFGSI